MISGLGVDVSPLIGEAVARGGHIRVGLEDALLDTPVKAWRCHGAAKDSNLCRFNGYFSTSTTNLRTTLTALSRWGARSAKVFDL